MKVAVATIWDGNAGFRCAILGWCQSAANFARVLAAARPDDAPDAPPERRRRQQLLLLLDVVRATASGPAAVHLANASRKAAARPATGARCEHVAAEQRTPDICKGRTRSAKQECRGATEVTWRRGAAHARETQERSTGVPAHKAWRREAARARDRKIEKERRSSTGELHREEAQCE